MTYAITGEQAHSLIEVLTDHIDGDAVAFTQQRDGTIIVAFSHATVEISASGATEEN